MSKKAMAYPSQGKEVGSQGKKKYEHKDFPEKAKAAPKVKPSMQHKEPEGPYKYPMEGQQSMAPNHKKQKLPMKDAPEQVSAPNGGSSYMLPKGGGVGETEV